MRLFKRKITWVNEDCHTFTKGTREEYDAECERRRRKVDDWLAGIYRAQKYEVLLTCPPGAVESTEKFFDEQIAACYRDS